MTAMERTGPATLATSAGNGGRPEAHPVRAAVFAWEDWFRQASTIEQGQALALAQRQGYVYAHQLPAPTVRAKPPPQPTLGDGLDGLRALLAGKLDKLMPPAPRGAEQLDPALTHLQQQASARIAASPDLALLRTKPGQAAAVLADVILQASRAGQRVLLLTQQAAHLDPVLQRLHGRDAVLPVRFLDPGENVAQLAPAVRPYTLDAQRQLFQSNTLVKAQAGRAEAEERCRRRYDEEPLWPQLSQLAERHAVLEEKRQALRQRSAGTVDEVRREAEGVPGSGKSLPSGPFALQVVEFIKEFNQQNAQLDQAENALRERAAAARAELARLQADEAACRPLADARRQGRWWTGAWWRARFTSDLAGRLADLERQRAGAQATLDAVAEQLHQNAELRARAEAKLQAEHDALIVAEGERRRAAWAAQVAEIEKEQEPLQRQWQTLIARLDKAQHPATISPVVVADAQARWLAIKQEDDAACLFARQWASFVQEMAPNFIAQLPRYASLLAGTIASLTKNPDFAAFADGPFDLVIVDDADRLLENDLLRLARKGRRWLFIGQVQGGNGRPSSFDKLWQTLHADPAVHIHYRWAKEGERWCCQLRPVAAPERRHLETERLADFPEIELRILALPKAKPQLVQVVFPAGMSLAHMKGFIHRELEEAAIQPAGRGAWLEERADAWTLHLGPPASSELIAVELEPGLREWTAPHGLTHRLDFEKSRWQRPQVDDWIHQCLNLRDWGRTFELA